ncbi:hypothetical protein GCM10018782_52510 [Streptomyces griseoaurantiacus]|nr:hypothetical protein GCM10018782_52510 [Streptomyces griseoaurantiacus]
MLGLYVSDHPLFGLEHVLSGKADAGIAQLTGGEHSDGAVVTIGGIISGLQRKMTKQGNAWAIATVEDLAGSIECITHNFFRLSSDAYAEGWLQKWPRMDKETISQGSEGIVASTGCPSGEVQTRLRLGQEEEALKAAADYQDIFGKDRYFLELMDHGIDIEHRVRDGLLEIGRKLGIPPLVTNDSHYTYVKLPLDAGHLETGT